VANGSFVAPFGADAVMEDFQGDSGYFYIVMDSNDFNMESSFVEHVSSVNTYAALEFSKAPIVDLPYLGRDFRLSDDESSSDTYSGVDSETDRRLRELEEESYDDANAPKIGIEYQCSVQRAFEDPKFYQTPEQEEANAGELVWRPDRLSSRVLDLFLAQTQCAIEDDMDDFFAPSRNPDTSSVVDMTSVDGQTTRQRPKLITQEQVYRVLHDCNYDTEAAKAKLQSRNEAWSAKKREFEPWNEADVLKFEAGMRFHHKRFPKILKDDMVGVNKSLQDVMSYYYTWKKLPRYGPWKKRRMTSRSLAFDSERPAPAPSPAPVYDPQTNAPVKFDEFFEFRQFMGLRSRPRIDYSSSSSGTHIWRTATGGYKRKQRQEESTDSEEEGKEFPPLEVFDVSVYADIDLDMVRHVKRARREPVDFDDSKLLAELAAQEKADLLRLGVGDDDSLPNFDPMDTDQNPSYSAGK
jgi:hypothetical protein